MSQTGVLIGFSCSGKTTLGKAVAKEFAKASIAIDYRDSDLEIGKAHGGSIAGLFVARGRPEALATVEADETAFLNSLGPTTGPRLVVTGPNLPLRQPAWADFVSRVNPLFYYLEVQPNTVYNRLKQRHDAYRRKYTGEPNNGCWNEDILCSPHSGRQVDFSREEAMSRIPGLMAQQVGHYVSHAVPSRTFQSLSLTLKLQLASVVTLIFNDIK